MTLDFKWGNTDVMLSGVTFGAPGTVRFVGRFRAIVLTEVVAVSDGIRKFDIITDTNPGHGDTGTGTGQQT